MVLSFLFEICCSSVCLLFPLASIFVSALVYLFLFVLLVLFLLFVLFCFLIFTFMLFFSFFFFFLPVFSHAGLRAGHVQYLQQGHGLPRRHDITALPRHGLPEAEGARTPRPGVETPICKGGTTVRAHGVYILSSARPSLPSRFNVFLYLMSPVGGDGRFWWILGRGGIRVGVRPGEAGGFTICPRSVWSLKGSGPGEVRSFLGSECLA